MTARGGSRTGGRLALASGGALLALAAAAWLALEREPPAEGAVPSAPAASPDARRWIEDGGPARSAAQNGAGDALEQAAEPAAAPAAALACALEGRVVDELGAPLEGAWVEAQLLGEPLGGVGLWSARSDGQGRYRIALPQLEALTPGRRALREVRVRGQAPGRRDDVKRHLGLCSGPDVATLRLVRGGALQGRVLDAAGNPVEGAEVELEGAPVAWSRGQGVMARTSSDARGRFCVDVARDGASRLVAWRGDLGVALLDVHPSRHEAREVGPLVLAEQGTISGRVVLADGRPAPGYTVRATRAGGGERVQQGGLVNAGAAVGRDGGFRLACLAPGSYSLQAWGPAPSRVARADTGARDVELRVDAPVALVRVVDAGGRPLPGALVELRRSGPEPAAFRRAAAEGPHALAVFALEGPTELELQAGGGPFESATLPVRPLPRETVLELTLVLRERAAPDAPP